MGRRLTIVFIVASTFLILALFGGLLWANAVFSRQDVGRDDFIAPWMGARAFLEHGTNPYDEAVAEMTQIAAYGRLAQKGEDPLRLDLPLFVELLFVPFALIKTYTLAHALWLTVLEFALAGLGLLGLFLTGWRPRRVLLVLYLLLMLLWVHALLPLASGHMAILATLCLVGGLAALRVEAYEWAGALFALAAFKPDVSGVFLLFILWWLVYHRRWRLLWGAMMALALLLAVSFMILPGWGLSFMRNIVSNAHISPALTPAEHFSAHWPLLGDKLGWALTIALTIVLSLEWHAVRHKDFRHFLWTVSLTLAVTPLFGVPTEPAGYVFLALPLTLVISLAAERWRWPMGGGLLLLIFAGLWAWVWHLSALNAAAQLRTVLFFASPVFLLLCLYWVRWWAIRPPRTWLDTIQE